MRRREFIRRAAAATAGLVLGKVASGCGDGNSSAGDSIDEPLEGGVAHLLPTVSHDRFLVKASFLTPQTEAPELLVDGRPVRGTATDTLGLFWQFDAAGLDPGRFYRLDLRRGRTPIMGPWELPTFPAPDARPERFRLLAYTCAGGNDLFELLYVPTPARQRLLQRALEFQPHAVVANGDHVYWDLRAGNAALITGRSVAGETHAGVFDRSAAVLGHPNEEVLKRAVGSQIAGLYGTMFRSIPVFFLRDDHDYFEDDQVTEELITFPPDDFMIRLARATQHLYYPEFLPDPNRPADLPGSSAADRPSGVSEAFGTLRYGRLFEGLLYDCKGFLSLAGERGMVPAAVDSWLRARMADSDATHVVNLPSNPPGWTAGKFAEWYPDVLDDNGRLTTAVPKPGWQPGWLEQHDRLVAAAAGMPRLPLFVSGDIHSIAEGLIQRSGAHELGDNPVVSLITGTPGTGLGWPSAARGTRATAPEHIDLETVVPVREENGFHLIDFEPDRVVIQHFRWNRRREPVEAIDTLMPFAVTEYPARR